MLGRQDERAGTGHHAQLHQFWPEAARGGTRGRPGPRRSRSRLPSSRPGGTCSGRGCKRKRRPRPAGSTMTSSAASGAIQRNLRLRRRPSRPPPRVPWRAWRRRGRAGRPRNPRRRRRRRRRVRRLAEAGDEPAPRLVLVLVLDLGRLAVLAVLTVRAALSVLVLRTEIAGVVAGLRGVAGVPVAGFGAGKPLRSCARASPPGFLDGPGPAAWRAGIVVPGLVVHRLVPGRQRPEVLIRAPRVHARKAVRPLRPLGYRGIQRHA